MSQQIEIEYKTMLTKKEFIQLLNNLPFPRQPITQINHYFETEQFDLKRHRSALRIREKGQHYTLTLKQPHEKGILETNDSLTDEEANSWLRGKPIPQKNIMKQLHKIGIAEDKLRYYGSLKTERYTFEKDGIYYMLDKSFYNDKIDYELEIEAPSKNKGIKALYKLLREQHIEERTAITKIERFFQTTL